MRRELLKINQRWSRGRGSPDGNCGGLWDWPGEPNQVANQIKYQKDAAMVGIYP
jgi:hypothetical protein